MVDLFTKRRAYLLGLMFQPYGSAANIHTIFRYIFGPSINNLSTKQVSVFMSRTATTKIPNPLPTGVQLGKFSN